MREYLSVLRHLALLGFVVLGSAFGAFYVVFLVLARLGILRWPAAWAAGALTLAIVMVVTMPERVLPFQVRLRMAGVDNRMRQTGFRDDDIPRLITSLGDHSGVDDNATASAILAGRGAHVVPALVAALDSPNEWTRNGAARALAWTGPAARVAIPRVIRRLADDPSWFARSTELSFLEEATRWGDTAAWAGDAVPAVVPYLKDAGNRGEAALTLAALGAAAAPALGDLRRAQAARRTERPDPFLDERLASAIRSICDAVRGTGSVPAGCS